jgi:hypothetical protein
MGRRYSSDFRVVSGKKSRVIPAAVCLIAAPL